MNKCERSLKHHMGATNHKPIIKKIQEKNNNRKMKRINRQKIIKEIKYLKISHDSTSTEVCKIIKNNNLKKYKIYNLYIAYLVKYCN